MINIWKKQDNPFWKAICDDISNSIIDCYKENHNSMRSTAKALCMANSTLRDFFKYKVACGDKRFEIEKFRVIYGAEWKEKYQNQSQKLTFKY